MTFTALEKTALTDIQRQFVADSPRANIQAPCTDLLGAESKVATPIACSRADDRRDLCELLTTRNLSIEPIVHVYQVWAEPGSIRAWVYHTRQTDRLCFTGGSFLVALCDLRPESRTAGAIASMLVGASAPVQLTIPPLVAHGVRNIGTERAAFINVPTNVYRHETPDKSRIPFDSELIPFRW